MILQIVITELPIPCDMWLITKVLLQLQAEIPLIFWPKEQRVVRSPVQSLLHHIVLRGPRAPISSRLKNLDFGWALKLGTTKDQ